MKDQRRSRTDRQDRKGRQEAAEGLAIAALTFIASEPERLGRFLALTGMGPDYIREAAHDPGFFLGVLDHLAEDEVLLLAFAGQSDIDPDDVGRARLVLAGDPEGFA